MSQSHGAQPITAPGWRRLQRPAEITDGTRWLFGVLALATLAIQVGFSLAFDAGWVPWAGLGAAAVLGTCWIASYRWGRVPWWLDLVEATAILGFALSGHAPDIVFGILLSAMWFRALYGSRWQSVARCAIYAGVVVLTFTFWAQVPGHVALAYSEKNPAGLAVVVLTVVVGRQLGRGLAAREQSLRVNAALAAAGSQLIGMTDETAIRTLAWETAVDICSTSPDLRMLRILHTGIGLRAEVATGRFDIGAAELPSGLVSTTPGAGTVLADPAPLNLAAGATLAWMVFDLPKQNDHWLVLGAPKAVPIDVVLAVRSLINQCALALNNSDIHHELIAQASVDSLTGLSNRASFNAELASELAGLRDDDAVQVLFVDLDDFKHVNDRLGHRTGDLLLREVALRLRRYTRPDDVCARIGGDEFAIILPATSETVAMDIAHRTVTAIAAPMRLGEHAAHVGACIGVATATAGTDLETAVHHADVAMYAAKARGKGRTQLFHADLLTGEVTATTFAQDLAAAAALGQLLVHYQPILTLPGLRCTAVEALVRWHHPHQGLLPPEDFIHIAESTGAISDVGAFVLGRACADTVTWQREHPGSPLSVHVNVSATQLDDDGFITVVIHHLAESGLPASQLVLELTESVVSGPAAVVRLRDLAGLGVRIAIDDFGTGFSSLTTLRALPVHVIKLDRSFVDGALTSATDRTVITAIVAMSHQLGLHTVAEGVERPEQQQFLEAIGTDAVQGYLHLRPVPAPQLSTWLRDNLHPQPQVPSVHLLRGA